MSESEIETATENLAEMRVVGARMRERRKAIGLTQTDVAVACKTHQSRYSDYESGKRACPPSRLAMIAEALKTTPAELLGTGNEPETST